MNKNAIKKYAIWAREELIKRVSVRADKYGISKDNIIEDGIDTVNGILLTDTEKKQRAGLIEQVRNKGYEQVMEEVAYTWFNRFCALRFMEINGYLPTHIRVFTDADNNFVPQIMAEAIHLELDGLDRTKVLELKEKNNNEELYKYLLITQCNALNSILPGMFQKISDYTELLFPDNILREGSVIQQMIELVPDEDWQDAVQIIGWLYQYYNSVPKDTVFANLKKNIKVTKEDIPAATQLFTPDWIVRYMVENSLGRLWLEHCQAESGLNAQQMSGSYFGWKYYLDEAEQEPEVQAQLDEIRTAYKDMKPEDIKCIDPCMGSGHILVYMFDVLMQIYESYGYSTRDAVVSVLYNNLYGLDIDDRAAQLAYFAVMMKARQYDSRFFSRHIQPNIYAIVESNNIESSSIQHFINGRQDLQVAMDTLLIELQDAKEYGSIINVTSVDFDALYARFDELQDEVGLFGTKTINELLPLIRVAHALARKYDVVVTNPPYMGSSNMGAKLSNFVKQIYPDSKSDLFSCFIEKGNNMVVENGYNCMVTMQSWMFLSSFETMRKNILNMQTISNLMHMENMVMGIAFGTAVANFKNISIKKFKGTYNHITIKDIDDNDTPKEFPVKENRFAQVSAENFSKIPGSPIAYWVSNGLVATFLNPTLYTRSISPSQNVTGNNIKYVRKHWEIKNSQIGGKDDWIFYAKGGGFRKWWGNLFDVVNWTPPARVVYQFGDGSHASQIINKEYWYKKGITWGLITSALPSFRIMPEGATYDKGGSTVIVDENIYNTTLGLLNSKVYLEVASILNPTLNFQVKDVRLMPFIENEKEIIDKLVSETVLLSKTDWDSFETSWDFKRHPLIPDVREEVFVNYNENGVYPDTRINVNLTIENAYNHWQEHTEKQFNQLKANEEELNRIFIEIYGLQDELTPEVEDKDVTVRKADLTRDIKSFISYAVGCMFGRYSLDVSGLAYAGGEWDASKYITYTADPDNIIPICDDEYFDDDIVGLFVKFVEVVYGANTLDENLRFIADALGGRGSAKEVIRNYFLNNFFADHCKIYQKRPIYWLFDSGKQNGFKALTYLHRYQADTLARIRTDYVHEQQGRYRTAIADLERRINDASTAERVKLNKQLAKLKEQDAELHVYEEKIHHLADQMITIDLDDGVKHNYELFKDVLAKIK